MKAAWVGLSCVVPILPDPRGPLLPMTPEEISGTLEFLHAAERLKSTWRSGRTVSGEPESVAAHSWRLALFALLVDDAFPEVHMDHVLRLCLVHDLGEAVGGDIPAVEQDPENSKSEAERRDLLALLAPLPERKRNQLLALWDEYEACDTPEARLAKALDKLETLFQHVQGDNPSTFDYAFNLEYGTRYTTGHPLIEELRRIADEGTQARAEGAPPPPLPPSLR